MTETRFAGTRRQPRVPEKHVQSQVVTLLRSIGAVVYVLGTRRPRGSTDFSTRQTAGIADLFALLPAPRVGGRACGLWVEVKADGGRLRPEQDAFRKQCIVAGVPHVVGGVDQVASWLVDGGWLARTGVAHYRLPPTERTSTWGK